MKPAGARGGKAMSRSFKPQEGGEGGGAIFEGCGYVTPTVYNAKVHEIRWGEFKNFYEDGQPIEEKMVFIFEILGPSFQGVLVASKKINPKIFKAKSGGTNSTLYNWTEVWFGEVDMEREYQEEEYVDAPSQIVVKDVPSRNGDTKYSRVEDILPPLETEKEEHPRSTTVKPPNEEKHDGFTVGAVPGDDWGLKDYKFAVQETLDFLSGPMNKSTDEILLMASGTDKHGAVDKISQLRRIAHADAAYSNLLDFVETAQKATA